MKQRNSAAPPRRRTAFTLIELLVVLAIIALLAGILLPAASRVFRSGQGAGCASNVRQISTAFLAFEGDFQYLPWSNEGFYSPKLDATGAQTNNTFYATNWVTKLQLFKYLPTGNMKGVWLCPGASYASMVAKDVNGNPANYGGYGICYNIFRQQNNLNNKGTSTAESNVPQRPLKSTRITRPAHLWAVGDCAQPLPNTTPGSGKYYRTSSGFSRPGNVGQWDFTTASPNTASQPALRHNGEACFATFDGHATRMDWDYMKGETNNFTARNESI